MRQSSVLYGVRGMARKAASPTGIETIDEAAHTQLLIAEQVAKIVAAETALRSKKELLQAHIANLEAQVAALEQEAEAEKKPALKLIASLGRALFDYVEYNSPALFSRDLKSRELAGGSIALYDLPSSVAVPNKDAFIAEAKKRHMYTRFVQITETVRLQALAANLAIARTFASLRVTPGRKFIITPPGFGGRHQVVYYPHKPRDGWQVVEKE